MTTLLHLIDHDASSSIELAGNGDSIFIDATHESLYQADERVSFNLTKEKARLLIESIQSYFKLDA